jgi:HSP20 family protein
VDRPRRPDPDASLLPEFRGSFGGDCWEPAVDVFETEKAIVVRVELAGVASASVRVTVDGEWLLIRGERFPSSDAEVRRLHRLEIACGPFERRLRIGIPFDRDQVVASLDEGILKIELRKGSPQRIEVRGGS